MRIVPLALVLSAGLLVCGNAAAEREVRVRSAKDIVSNMYGTKKPKPAKPVNKEEIKSVKEVEKKKELKKEVQPMKSEPKTCSTPKSFFQGLLEKWFPKK